MTNNQHEMTKDLSRIRHVALDGTIYLGNTLFPYTHAFLQQLRDLGITYSFLTNNPSRSINDYLLKLHKMGIEATKEEIYNTTVATIDYLKTHLPGVRRLFLLGAGRPDPRKSRPSRLRGIPADRTHRRTCRHKGDKGYGKGGFADYTHHRNYGKCV